MVQKGKKTRKNSHPIIHFPASEGVSEVSDYARMKRAMSDARERAKGRANDPVLQSGFLIILALSAQCIDSVLHN